MWRNYLVSLGYLSCIKLFVSRFIAASNKCTMKPLSGLLTACLHTVNLHFKEYNYYYSGVFKNSDINCFWIVNNSLLLIYIVIIISIYSK